jgi:glucose/arabinose dehydrogenase
MRALILAAMLAVCLQGAWAQEAKVKTDPSAAPETQMKTEAEAGIRLQAIAKKLEEAGFKDIQVVPQAILVQATDGSGKPVVMIVDTLSMVAIELKTQPDSGTTGSGSSDDGKPR